MTDSFLHRVLEAAVAGVLAVVATLGGGPVAGPEPSSPPGSPSARPSGAPSASASGTPTASPSGTPSASPPGTPSAGRGASSVGRDISWPNCPVGQGIPSRRTLGLPLPPPGTAFLVIGLTNGPGFYPNPCLRGQVAHARRLGLWTAAYAVVTFPTREELRRYGAAGPRSPGTKAARLWNAGWAQASANVGRMRTAGLDSPVVWVDVEPVRPPTPWSEDIAGNRTVLEGAIAGYEQSGVRVGVYSTAYLWSTIVGDARYGLPEWRPAGQVTRRAALELCTRGGIQGGEPVLVQWYDDEVDRDALCPGRPAGQVLQEYFTRL